MRPMQNRLAKAKADRRFKAFLLVSIHTCSGCPPCSGTYGIPPPCAIFRSVFLGEYFLTDFYPIPPLFKEPKNFKHTITENRSELNRRLETVRRNLSGYSWRS
jgi:hypothetical protein